MLVILGLLVAAVVAQGSILTAAIETEAEAARKPMSKLADGTRITSATGDLHRHVGSPNECPECPPIDDCSTCPSANLLPLSHAGLLPSDTERWSPMVSEEPADVTLIPPDRPPRA